MTGIGDDPPSLNAATDAAIEACGGDARAAVRALIVANNYLEAEVQRLAKAVSAGFARGSKPKGRELPAFPRIGEERANVWHDIEHRFPYFVDLVPPEDGFSEEIEDQMARFLESLDGKCDQFVDLRGDELRVRYCFAREQAAAAFHTAFAGPAVSSRFKMTG
jgi:hypothetical protein